MEESRRDCLIVTWKDSQVDEPVAERAPYPEDVDIDTLQVVLEVIHNTGSARLWDYAHSLSNV